MRTRQVGARQQGTAPTASARPSSFLLISAARALHATRTPRVCQYRLRHNLRYMGASRKHPRFYATFAAFADLPCHTTHSRRVLSPPKKKNDSYARVCRRTQTNTHAHTVWQNTYSRAPHSKHRTRTQGSRRHPHPRRHSKHYTRTQAPSVTPTPATRMRGKVNTPSAILLTLRVTLLAYGYNSATVRRWW